MQIFLQFFAKVSFRAGDEGVNRLSPSHHKAANHICLKKKNLYSPQGLHPH